MEVTQQTTYLGQLDDIAAILRQHRSSEVQPQPLRFHEECLTVAPLIATPSTCGAVATRPSLRLSIFEGDALAKLGRRVAPRECQAVSRLWQVERDEAEKAGPSTPVIVRAGAGGRSRTRWLL